MASDRAKTKRSASKAVLRLLLIAAAAAVITAGVFFAADKIQKNTYKLEYSEFIEGYASIYGLDRYLVYSFVQTESGFNAKAVSNAGARGLMQIMPDTFEWIRYRLGEDSSGITFNDMFDPKQNIRYGCYLLAYLADTFGNDKTCIAAAYHAGTSSVFAWLDDPALSENGRLIKIPNSDTAHYAEKINTAYSAYKKLYADK